jgi:hypothetical protein
MQQGEKQFFAPTTSNLASRSEDKRRGEGVAAQVDAAAIDHEAVGALDLIDTLPIGEPLQRISLS